MEQWREDVLVHYGVKGMKWGFRKERKKTNKKNNKFGYGYNKSVKKGIKIGLAITGAVAASVAAVKVSHILQDQAYVRGRNAIKRIASSKLRSFGFTDEDVISKVSSDFVSKAYSYDDIMKEGWKRMIKFR